MDRVILDGVQITKDDHSITARMYGITVHGGISRARDPESCLLVYIQGHGGTPSDFGYFHDLKRWAVAAGCDVVALSMIGRGMNAEPVWFPPKAPGQGRVHFTESE